MPKLKHSREETRDTYVAFELRPFTDAAHRLVGELVQLIVEWEGATKSKSNRATSRGPYKRGLKGLASITNAVERFVGYVLIANEASETGKVARSLSKETFKGQLTTFTAFKAVVDAMTALDLLTHTPGSRRFIKKSFDGKPQQLQGTAATFGPTPKLLLMAERAGIPPADAGAHFVEPHPAIQLRAPRQWQWSRGLKGLDSAQSYRTGGEDLEVPDNDDTQHIQAEVRELNAFLSGFTIEGARFFGFFRGFNECADPAAFKWNKGGRLYAYGRKAYQSLSQDERTGIKINGAPTVELDISASYLTAFHGLIGKYLRANADDVWHVPGTDRDALKEWVNISLTQGQPANRWPQETSERVKSHAIEAVREKALTAFPALQSLKQSGLTWSDLMFAESEAVLRAMLRLKQNGVPSLPVFDSLIVPVSGVRLATGVLHDEYYKRIGLPPLLKAKGTVSAEVVTDMREALEDDERYYDAVHL